MNERYFNDRKRIIDELWKFFISFLFSWLSGIVLNGVAVHYFLVECI